MLCNSFVNVQQFCKQKLTNDALGEAKISTTITINNNKNNYKCCYFHQSTAFKQWLILLISSKTKIADIMLTEAHPSLIGWYQKRWVLPGL